MQSQYRSGCRCLVLSKGRGTFFLSENAVLALLQKHALSKAAGRQLLDVRIGLCYTAVLLDNGSAGLAYTFRRDIPEGCASFQDTGALAGITAAQALRYLASSDLLERTIGLATANALINQKAAGLIEGDVLGLLAPAAHDRVGMVGYFGPLVPALRATVRELFIFEREPGRAAGVYPAEKACELLPLCSLAIITSTTLINGTLAPLLAAAQGCRTIALVGPSTPLEPALFRPVGVTLLSGVIVIDPHALLQRVSEAGGMPSFKGCIQKVNCPA